MKAEYKVKRAYPLATAYRWPDEWTIEDGLRLFGRGSSEAFAWESAAENIPDLQVVKP